MSLSAQTAFLIARKNNFAGRTDKYSTANFSKSRGSIGDALGGNGPFDVSSQLFDDRSRDIAINRLARYRNNWRYYRGEHHPYPYQDGEKKPVVNFCRPIVDKAVEYFTAKGWKVTMPQGNELVADVVNRALEYNFVESLTSKIKQFSSVTGDGFLYVSVRTVDEDGNNLPKAKWSVSLTPLNPSFCFPIFNDRGDIERILIQYPSSTNPMDNSLFSMVITRKTYQLFKDDSPLTPPTENPFGMVNVVHFPNLGLGYSNYGMSDLDDVIPLNDSYNSTMFSLERIIRYHAEPTTIIQGAKASNLEKGANKVWSNIPVEGKVYNLAMTDNLAGLHKQLELLKSQMCEISSTPKASMDGSELPHSNTPGVTMEYMFKPLLDKTNRSWQVQGPAWKRVVKLVMLAHKNIMGEDLSKLADAPEKLDQVALTRTSPMPRDEKNDFDLAMAKMKAGILSRAAVIRDFAGREDSERLALELAADKMAELSEAAELSKAQQGIPPNLNVAFIASPNLTEDLTELSTKISEMDTEVSNRKPAVLTAPAGKP